MSYTANDFMETILDALDVDTDDDDVSAQADLCLKRIAQLKRSELGPRALHTVLAALTYWQGVDSSFDTITPELSDVLTKGGRLKSLDAAEIDDLCKRLSTPATPELEEVS